MAKKNRKIVEAKDDDKKTNVTIDSHHRIVEAKDAGEPKERATGKRVAAIILWLFAIACEVIAILKLKGVIEWIPQLSKVTFVIIALVLDLIFVVIGSQLWKKANHIDPASEKDKLRFWLHNNLGVIISVIAFAPLIVLTLTDKNLSKKDKTLVSAIAVVALLIAGFSSYDYNPVSAEQLAKAKQDVLLVNPDGKVYYTEHGKKYHVSADCQHLQNSETVIHGTIEQAYEHGITELCKTCYKKMLKEKGIEIPTDLEE